jgi:nucleoside-diphosphate-sugar epimerase
MRILVLGGTGLTGPHVVKHLVEMGHDVTIFHRGEHEPDLPPGVKHVHSDQAARPLAAIPDELRDLSPDVVVFMVPVGERDARIVVDAFKGAAGRMVAVSSMDVYRAYGLIHRSEQGPLEPVPFDEDAPLRQRFYPYRGDTPRAEDDPTRFMDDYDKILAERIIMGEPSMPGTVIRFPMVYGEGDRQHRLFEYLKRMEDNRPVILLSETVSRFRSSRGYTENVALAVALSATDERAAGRIYNVAETEVFSEADWVRRVAEAASWHGEIVIVPDEAAPEHLRWEGNAEQHLIGDSARIRSELGYAERVRQDEWLRRTVAWERANPPEQIDQSQFDYAAEDAALAGLG